ncbi:hypothetical protein LEP1GSC084_0658 [Leptospira interrogans serovar Medanensis str. L0448]|nr:hypothetical protein LEP1GSC084_0658 [Leptospira interrogans serovar Medanensis str. L0448]
MAEHGGRSSKDSRGKISLAIERDRFSQGTQETKISESKLKRLTNFRIA